MSFLDIFKKKQIEQDQTQYYRGAGMGGGTKKVNYWKPADEIVPTPETGDVVLDNSIDKTEIAYNPANAIFSKGMRGKDITIMRTMGYEPTIMSCKNLIQAGIKQLQYSLNYTPDTKQTTIELFEKQLKQIDIYELIGSVLQGYFYGYNITQLIWKDRLIVGVRDCGYADFAFSNSGELTYVDEEKVLPNTNFYPAVYQQSRYNLYGEAIFASIYESWTRKMNLQYYWMEYCRKYGTPIALGKIKNIPHDKKNDEQFIQGKIIDALEKIELFNENSYAAVIDELMEIDFMTPAAQGQKTAYETYIDNIDKQIVRALLGSDSVSIATAGRLGNNAEASQNFQIILENIRAFVVNNINKILVFVGKNNNIDPEQIPTFRLSDGQNLDYDIKRAQLDMLRSQMGIELTDDYFIKYYSDLDNENFVRGTPTEANAVQTNVIDKKSKIVNFASSIINQAKQSDVIKKARANESVLNEFLETVNTETGIDTSFEIMRNDVKELLSLYDKPADVRKDIANIFDSVNDKAIIETMEKILTATDLYGKDSVQTEGE